MTELYVFPPSPRAFKVMAIANHLGIEPTLHVLDLIKGEQKSPRYAALNPNMRMPTLRDGNYVLWESNAILNTSPPSGRRAICSRPTRKGGSM
jgi:glutathione S-transferase